METTSCENFNMIFMHVPVEINDRFAEIKEHSAYVTSVNHLRVGVDPCCDLGQEAMVSQHHMQSVVLGCADHACNVLEVVRLDEGYVEGLMAGGFRLDAPFLNRFPNLVDWKTRFSVDGLYNRVIDRKLRCLPVRSRRSARVNGVEYQTCAAAVYDGVS